LCWQRTSVIEKLAELPETAWLAGYGNVVELRINSGGKLPNFGFVVFDDSEPVQKVLSNRVSA
jgi:hypothetical protein